MRWRIERVADSKWNARGEGKRTARAEYDTNLYIAGKVSICPIPSVLLGSGAMKTVVDLTLVVCHPNGRHLDRLLMIF
jgi:hypothetical protein